MPKHDKIDEIMARALAEREPSPGFDAKQKAAWVNKYWKSYVDDHVAPIREALARAGYAIRLEEEHPNATR